MIEILLSGLFWRLRGIMGWPFTVLFALVQVFALYPVIGNWSLLFGLWVFAGEPTGWKPKAIWDRGEWWRSALLGFRIGGIGAVCVPLSTWLHDKIGEPPFPNNPKAFKLPFWDSPKFLLDWRGAWNEVWFGIVFNIIILCIAGFA